MVVAALVCCAATLSTAGCRRASDLELVIVSGTATYQGKPIEDGEIRFVPSGETKGPTSVAAIQQGHYEAAGRGGVPAGTHRVEIRAFGTGHGQQPMPDLPGITPGGLPKEQFIPKNYNEQSTLTATIESSQRRITKDFAVGER